MEEIWKSIPGIPNYQVSDLGRVKHLRRDGKETILKKHGRSISIRINGTSTTVSIGKMIYAAFSDIDISLLDRLRTTGETLKELRVFDFGHFLREQNKTRRLYDTEKVRKMQIEAYEDLKSVIEYWESNDSTILFTRMASHENAIISYTCKKFNLRYSVAKYLWDTACFNLVNDITYQRKSVAAFGVYLRCEIRVLVHRRRAEMKRILEFDDRIGYKFIGSK